MRDSLKRLKSAGFTIVELLIVIIVIGILVAISIVAYNGVQKNAIDKAVISDIDGASGEVARYGTKNQGVYGPAVAWYSPSGANGNISFTQTQGNVIDVVADASNYCVRAYNTSALSFNTLVTAAKKESNPGVCALIPPSSTAQTASPTATPNWTTFTQRTGAGFKDWLGVASSSDGSKLVAIPYSDYISTSTDFGVTWTVQTSSTQQNWTGVSSSSDGTKLAASSFGNLYTSADSGVTWVQRTAAGSNYWGTIASSADGQTIYAGYSGISKSTDAGVTWSDVPSAPFASSGWSSMAVSPDGSKVSAINSNPQLIWLSTNAGSSWTALTRPPISGMVWLTQVGFSNLSSLFASSYGNLGGAVYTSNDSGISWKQRMPVFTVANGSCSGVVTSSSDGSRLMLGINNDSVSMSKDSGVTWVQQPTTGAGCWRSMGTSSDGTRLVGVTGNGSGSGGYIYTFTMP